MAAARLSRTPGRRSEAGAPSPLRTTEGGPRLRAPAQGSGSGHHGKAPEPGGRRSANLPLRTSTFWKPPPPVSRTSGDTYSPPLLPPAANCRRPLWRGDPRILFTHQASQLTPACPALCPSSHFVFCLLPLSSALGSIFSISLTHGVLFL